MKTDEMESILDSTYSFAKGDESLVQMGPFLTGTYVSRRILILNVSWCPCKALILHNLPEYVSEKVIREKSKNAKSWSQGGG